MTEPESDSIEPQAVNATPQPGDALIGQVLEDKIEILALIASGASASVYKGYHKLLDKPVAIKVLNQRYLNSESSIQRFRNEALILSSFASDKIVRFYSFGQLPDQRKYMLIEFVDGKSLAEKLQSSGPLESAEALPIFEQIATALSYAHSRNVVHRDIKPANVMLTYSGNNQVSVKLLDFGIFKALESDGQNLTQTGLALGSVNYMSPEQCKSQGLDARSDIYSLACLMYETLVGTPPMQDVNDMMIMSNHANKQLRAVPAKHPISNSLESCILRCLEKNPADRFPDCQALTEALQVCKTDQSTNSKAASKVKPSKAFLIKVLVAAGLAATVFFVKANVIDKNAKEAPEHASATLGLKPGNVDYHNLKESEDWLSLCITKYPNKYSAMDLADVYSNCATARLMAGISGVPPHAREVEQLLLQADKSRAYKTHLDYLVKLAKFYAVSGDSDKAFAVFKKLEEPAHDEGERNGKYRDCFDALSIAFNFQRKDRELERLMNIFHRYADKSHDQWTKILSLQRECSYTYEHTRNKKKARLLALEASALLSEYMNHNIIGINQHGTFVDLCKVLNNVGESQVLSALVKKEGGLGRASRTVDDSMSKIRLFEIEACLDADKNFEAAKLSGELVSQCLESNYKSKISDDIMACRLKALNRLGKSPQELKYEARKYLLKVQAKVPHRLYNSLYSLNQTLGEMKINRGELWRDLLSDIKKNPKANADDLRAIQSIFIICLESSDHRDSNLILELANEALKNIDEPTLDRDFYIKHCMGLSIVFSRHHELKKARECLKQTDKYVEKSSPSTQFEKAAFEAKLLKEEEHRDEAIQRMNELLNKTTDVRRLVTYTEDACTLARWYEQSNLPVEAIRCLEQASTRVEQQRPEKLEEQLRIHMDLSHLYSMANNQPKLDLCRIKIKELQKSYGKKERS